MREAPSRLILDQYALDFPSGVLFPEAAVLRVEAMIGTGNRVGAGRFADRLADRLPDRYMQRIRELLAKKATDM